MNNATNNLIHPAAASLTASHYTSFNELAGRLNRLDCGLNVFGLDGTLLLHAACTDAADDVGRYVPQVMERYAAAGHSTVLCGPNDALPACVLESGGQPLAVLIVQTPVALTDAPADRREKQYLAWILEDFSKNSVQGQRVLAQVEKISVELSQEIGRAHV